jgi:hypothetical protein
MMQVLLAGTCFFLAFQTSAQKKWEDIGLNLSPYRNIRSVYVDTVEDKLIFGGNNIDQK